MAERKKPLQEKLAALPHEPGVYLFIDDAKSVLYVGKAKDLRKRVRSYFTRSRSGDGRVFFPNIVEETVDLEVIVTDTEKEALILENSLILRHRPRYNIDFRDDKAYLSVRLTWKEPFPRLHPVRKIRRDGARYFGPYASASALRETLNLVKSRFPLRTCSPAFFANRSRPCIRYEMEQCRGPCCNRIDEATYRAVVKEAILFLEGKFPELTDALRTRMKEAADALNFEEAARLRDAAEAVEKTVQAQKVVSHDPEDLDVFGLYREGEELALAVLFVRGGRVVGSEGQTHPGVPENDEALASGLMGFYGGERMIPPTLLLPEDLSDRELLEEILSEKRSARVRILVPKRGPRRALVAMAGKNAAYALAHSDRFLRKRARAMEELRRRLRLPKTPHRIECFDASHITGSWAVGARAVFRDGKPDPKSTRTYRIRSVGGGDDFAMMGELIGRRFAPGKEDPPDLLLVDGGPGQLQAALRALAQAGGTDIPVAGIAKEREAAGGWTPDRIYLPGRKTPLFLPERDPALHLLQAVRDEAHRLAVKYHRKLRKARTLKSGLEEILGVGPKRRAALLKHFGSLKALRTASLEEIAAVPGVPRAIAQTIREFFRENPEPIEKGKEGGGEGWGYR
ncbi:MAG: excinuclease ABC subunit UvrC [Planctomycetota bacterium]|jgi:excinuclease ABC subunit C